MKGSGHALILRYYHDICLEGLIKTTKTLSQSSRSPGGDLNPRAPKYKSHYKMYCKILSKVIKEVKQNNYNSQILKSNNKIKSTRHIVFVVSGKLTVKAAVVSSYFLWKSTNIPQAFAS
jgi:hypothetical protein